MAAIAAADAAKLRHAAHTLKGSIDCFGARDAADVALRLELLARDGDFSQAPDAYQALTLELDRVRAALAQVEAGGA